MKKKNHYNPMEPDDLKAPDLKHQTMEVQCHTCGNMTSVDVVDELIDWKSVAKDYQKAADGILTHVLRMMQDIDVMQPDGNNPIRDYMQNEIKAFTGDWENKFKQ